MVQQNKRVGNAIDTERSVSFSREDINTFFDHIQTFGIEDLNWAIVA